MIGPFAPPGTLHLIAFALGFGFITFLHVVFGELASGESPGGAVQSEERPSVPPIGEEDIEEPTVESLFESAATSRSVIPWILTPSLSVVGSYPLFALLL